MLAPEADAASRQFLAFSLQLLALGIELATLDGQIRGIGTLGRTVGCNGWRLLLVVGGPSRLSLDELLTLELQRGLFVVQLLTNLFVFGAKRIGLSVEFAAAAVELLALGAELGSLGTQFGLADIAFVQLRFQLRSLSLGLNLTLLGSRGLGGQRFLAGIEFTGSNVEVCLAALDCGLCGPQFRFTCNEFNPSALEVPSVLL